MGTQDVFKNFPKTQQELDLLQELLKSQEAAKQADLTRQAAMGCLVLLMGLVPIVVLNAWILMCFWGWFIESLTHLHMGLGTALGVRLIASVITAKPPRTAAPTAEDQELVKTKPFWYACRALLMPSFVSLITLLMGYIVHWLMS